MLYALSTRHRKKIASVFLLVFYADMVIADTGQKFSGKGYSTLETTSKGAELYCKNGRLNKDGLTHYLPAFSTNNSVQNTRQAGKKEQEKLKDHPIIAQSGIKQEDDGSDPGQPEMQSFKSIGTDNMVDLFTGDFSYNIPLLDVGGYPINIFYSSGISMDQEASWVGLGWNINPGTISRNMRGVPDDFNGSDQVQKTMHTKEDITIGANVKANAEFTGFPTGNFSFGTGLFYNNYKGFGLEVSSGLSLADKTHNEKTQAVSPTAGLNINFNSQQGATISPSFGIRIYNDNRATSTSLTASVGYNSRIGIQNLQLSGEMKRYSKPIIAKQSSMDLFSGSLSFSHPSVTPSIRMPISRSNYNVGISAGGEVFFGYLSLGVNGYYSKARIADKDTTQKKPAYGYLYLDKGQQDDNALMDFNRINDGVYTQNTPVISFPAYTYDVYSISGEGTGGSFRPYRGDVGYIKDNYTKTRDDAFSINGEVGGGDLSEVGVNLHAVFSPTEVQEWKTGNIARNAFRFHASDSIYQGVYFKNPSEKTIGNEDFIKALGSEDLVRIRLSGQGTPYPVTMPVLERFGDNRQMKDTTVVTDYRTTKQQRDKRSQIITYLNAEEASKIGLDTQILSYPVNQYPLGGCSGANITPIKRYDVGKDPMRKGHHISEIDVLNPDGRRYIYGLPVYNISQEETTFATKELSADNGQIAKYDANDNSTINDKGRDNYYQSESVPSYAHSFLLTGLLSPDYVDVKGDGITEDDLGDAVKFNYSQINNSISGDNGFNWRAPFTQTEFQASFNEGLKTDNSDNKSSYTYGRRELWYLNSVESKNMIATFKIGNRWDVKEAKGRNGGINGGDVTMPGMKRLERIDLYSKADYRKDLSKAKPIKTVHFAYSYKLCQNTPSNISFVEGMTGKLTLDSIWFSYNGNIKQKENRYRFKYHNNPDYDRAANDRWGNYKPIKDAQNNPVNLGGMSNTDYPYSVQNPVLANQFASAWQLDEIGLPSGGKINVTYESDDYAYVQNRQAQQMFQIVGFGETKASVPVAQLYNHSNSSNKDYLYAFIDTKVPNTNGSEKRYFEGIKQLYLKLFMTVPPDVYGQGLEAVPVYAEIEEYGVYAANNNYLYVKVKPIRSNYSPMSSCAIQFLRDYLPSKAFKGSDVGAAPGIKQALLALKGLMTAVNGTFSDFEATARRSGFCNRIDVNRSFIRLNNGGFNKLGGGLRVKKVEITDNWEEMTQTKDANGNIAPSGIGMKKATYGQEYDYTTTREIEGQNKVISSGVATYEPGIGAEENPFREILRYSDKQPLGPTQNGAVEVPIGEMFYPAPMVGYSKVTVRSINRTNVKSGVGKQVTEFYTSKDFPVLSDFTDFDDKSKANFKSNPILQILKLDMRQTTTLSQGFRVQLNDMNGKIKTQSSFAEDNSTLITYTANYYRLQKKTDETYQLDNNVLATKGPDGNVAQTPIGRDVEMMVDFREHTSKTISTNIDLNVNVSGVGPFVVPIFSLVPPVTYEEAIYRSATLMKIVNRYGILDSVISIDKGSQVTTKDLLYDGETGNVLLTRTNNEFNAPVYNFNYPAHWAYSGMHPAYRNIDLAYKGLNFRNGILLDSQKVNLRYFESGDELYAVDNGESWIDNTEACARVGNNNTCVTPPKILKSFEKRIWVLDITKDKRNGVRSFIFIDRNGALYSADNVNIRVVRSGKRNMLNESVGTVTSRFSPLVIEAGQLKVKPQDANDVLNTAATTYKEHWRVDNAFYLKDSLVAVQTIVTPQTKTFRIDSTHYYGVSHSYKGSNTYTTAHNKDFLEARRQSFGSGKHSRRQYVSWGLINLDNSLNNKYIINATFILAPHYVDHNYNFLNTSNEDPQHVHGNMNPQNFPMTGGSIATLQRMLTPWNNYSINNLFDGDLLINTNSSAVDRTTQTNVIAALGDNAIQSKIYQADATAMIKAMINDKRNNSTNAPGFRMIISNQTTKMDDEQRTAFAKDFVRIFKPASTYITVDYLDCNAGSIIYDKATGQYKCATYSNEKLCLSVFNKSIINPYVQGILGNWRTERAYTYYGKRRESSVLNSTDLRNAGAIKDFKTYWNFNADSLRTAGNNDVWVWNSEITQFNKRGFEIENHDPLGRYNSGLYGYAQALPVAVANNAKHREIAFDGFEDYDYSTTPCGENCQPRRHMNIPWAQDVLHRSMTEVHTGKYSLKLEPSEIATVVDTIATINQDTASYNLRIHTDIGIATKTTVNLNGSGWVQENYKKENFDIFIDSFQIGQIYYPSLPSGGYSKRWRTIYIPTVTGTYYFNVKTDDGARLFVSPSATSRGNDLIEAVYHNYWSYHGAFDAPPIPVTMTIGVPYYIEMEYYNHDRGRETGSASLMIQKPCESRFHPISVLEVYPRSRSNQIPPVITETLYCIRPDTLQPRGNYLTDTFSMLQGKRMILSAWVKESVDCPGGSYLNNHIDLNFYDANGITGTPVQSKSYFPTGPIIEGWQRYESEFTVPVNAKVFQMHLKNTGSSGTTYFDDIRIHPFNANLKSFVYHPVNLRLMAELDENNYASFYEYDDDGTLVRVKKETIKGIKTINETRSALQKSITQ